MANETRFLIRILLFSALAMIVIPFLQIFFYYGVSHNVSLEPKYSEIYTQEFVVQNPLFLKQWSDTKELYLDKYDSGEVIATIGKGAKVRVKKVTQKHGFATTNVKILIETDTPKYSAINVSHLVISDRLGYSNDLAQFDPHYLKNSSVQTLPMAVQYEDFEAIKRLIANGADLNQQNLDGKAPLHYAKQADVALYLLEQGANPDVADKWGKTLLHYAAKQGDSDIIALLIQKGALIDLKDEDENTPLLCAAKARNFECVRLLLEAGSDPRLKGEYQNTVLLYAAQYDQLDIAELSLGLGADPLAVCDLSGMSGVLFAARNQNFKMAEFFVNAGAPVDCANNRGETPLHYASDNPILLQYLIENGADVQRTNERGRTALHKACQYDNLDAIKLLHEKGGNINQGDIDGETPFQMAIRNKNKKIIKWMTKTPLHKTLVP